MDVLIRHVMNDDIESVSTIIKNNDWSVEPSTPYTADNFKDVAICSKSVAMYDMIQNTVKFTQRTHRNIIRYTRSISIVNRIIENESSGDNQFVPHIDMFKNISLDIIKYLIEKTKWTDFDAIYNFNYSPQVLHYLIIKGYGKSSKYDLDDSMLRVIGDNKKIYDQLFTYNDVDFIGAVLDGCEINWGSSFITLSNFKMLLALGRDPLDALYSVRNFKINCYLAEHHIYPTNNIMDSDNNSFKHAVISLQLKPDLSNLTELCEKYGDETLARYFYEEDGEVTDDNLIAALATTNIPEVLDCLFDIIEIPYAYISDAIVSNPDIDTVEYMIYLYKKKSKSIKFITYALKRVTTLEKLKLLLSFDFSTWDDLLIYHDNIEILRYLNTEYDYSKKRYNAALGSTTSFDKIKFLVEECRANDYNSALITVCSQTTINFDIVKYLVDVGANNFEDALIIMCKNIETLNAFNDKLVLYFYNLGANNIDRILVILKSCHPLKELKRSSAFDMIVSISNNCNKVIINKEQLYFIKNGMGIFLYKNPALLLYEQAIPYIEYRNELVSILDNYFIYGLSGLVADYYGHIALDIDYSDTDDEDTKRISRKKLFDFDDDEHPKKYPPKVKKTKPKYSMKDKKVKIVPGGIQLVPKWDDSD